MRLLLDTHAMLWALQDNERLSRRARRAIDNARSQVFVSAVSVLELVTKSRLGRLPRSQAIASDVHAAISSAGFLPLDVTSAHAQRAGDSALIHSEPWDRLLAAQAIVEGLLVVSNDECFDRLGAPRFW